ncbi:hypothetical protein Aph02nite_04690 [Actinoplanes philippinensis]|uniref:Secreted protein n=1 Tax=Actinoplanes philippinensis TaxID=35752 RepID=A0A1I2D4A6_9ACTN|nr:hypothetical protein [Actinoplanes philippinensis]GIE74519.1 hypothetical protein Aph02nite_04690 [Actinoplanes philippinensis]SFE74800.1 hypothetical protein SAMN05421541_103367 [Actinoplanes philippinensis]
MTAVQAPPRAALTRLAGLRHTSPGRLQLLLAVLLVLTALTGLVTGLTAASAATGTGDLRDRAQPLLAEAETVWSSLADADATAAQAFITGGLEPPKLTDRYNEKLADAAAALTSAARRVPEGSAGAEAIRSITTGLSDYTALVATARALNRQGKPVGASYLSTASQLNRDTLQPQAQALFQQAQREASDGYAGARSSWWLMLLLVLLIVLGVALIATQAHLSRTTHRTFNVPLLTASALTVLLAVVCAGVFAHQRARLDGADRDGSAPAEALAENRNLVLRERADEALTLAARAGRGKLEDDFTTLRQRFSVTGPEFDEVAGLMAKAGTQHDAYLAVHDEIRRLDDNGDYEGAVRKAVSEETAATFDAVTRTLSDALTDRRAAFDDQIRSAGRGLGVLTILGPLLALAIGVCAALGLRARLEEYR